MPLRTFMARDRIKIIRCFRALTFTHLYATIWISYIMSFFICQSLHISISLTTKMLNKTWIDECKNASSCELPIPLQTYDPNEETERTKPILSCTVYVPVSNSPDLALCLTSRGIQYSTVQIFALPWTGLCYGCTAWFCPSGGEGGALRVTLNAIGLKLSMVIPINNTTCAK